MKLKFLIATLFIVQIIFSQNRTCGKDAKMLEIMSNPILKKKYEDRQVKFEKEYTKLVEQQALTGRFSPTATLNIPVAVHFPLVPNTTSAADKNCLIALAQSQMDVLNADFNGINPDISNWSSDNSFYPGVNTGNIDINFQISNQNHPAGTGLSNGMLAVTFGTDFLGDDETDETWIGYLNFKIIDAGGILNGSSSVGGWPESGEAILINSICFGTGNGCTVNGSNYVPQAPLNLGRIATHELGHYFFLDHTFESYSCDVTSETCDQEGDKVCDTPRVGDASYDCPAPGSVNACGTLKALTMNYMDYVDSACMYMFTQGQVTRMQAYINSIASEFNQNTLASDTFLVTPTFSVYPNPNNGDFSIDFDQNNIDNKVVVYEITGRKVYENNFQNVASTVSINLNSVSKGIYSIVVSNSEGTSSRKIVIK